MSPNSIEYTVMRRVRTIHMLKTVAGPAGKAALLALALVVIALQVSVPHVLVNMESISNPAAFFHFFAVAFTHTVFLVQAFSLVAILTLLWLFRDLFTGRTLAHARA